MNIYPIWPNRSSENDDSICFAQSSVPQKWKFSYETFPIDTQGVWKFAKTISKSFVNNSYRSSIVTMPVMPFDYYENRHSFFAQPHIALAKYRASPLELYSVAMAIENFTIGQINFINWCINNNN